MHSERESEGKGGKSNEFSSQSDCSAGGADFDSSGHPCWQRNAWVMMREGGRVRTTGWIERFIEVYHAAHSAATLPVLLLPIEVFASGGSMVPPQSLY